MIIISATTTTTRILITTVVVATTTNIIINVGNDSIEVKKMSAKLVKSRNLLFASRHARVYVCVFEFPHTCVTQIIYKKTNTKNIFTNQLEYGLSVKLLVKVVDCCSVSFKLGLLRMRGAASSARVRFCIFNCLWLLLSLSSC